MTHVSNIFCKTTIDPEINIIAFAYAIQPI